MTVVPAAERPLAPVLLLLFGVLLFVSGLGAYAVGPVPVQWIGLGLLVVVMLLVALDGRVHTLPGGGLGWALTAWLALVTFSHLPQAVAYSDSMPARATTPYWLFVPLRFVDMLAFLAAGYFVTWLLREKGRAAVLRSITLCGTVIAVVALYIYFAQIYGLPEPDRTRIGGDGGAQLTSFSYGFHRAMGTFREPSHLAEWLVVPLLLSVVHRGRWLNAQTILMAIVLLLTGSLTGLLGIGVGLLAGVFIAGLFHRNTVKQLVAVAVVGLLTVQLFTLFARVDIVGSAGPDLFGVLGGRLEPIMQGGLMESNRGFVYEYVQAQHLPLWGLGLGNATIALSAGIGTLAMSSHLSLYLNMLFSGGVVALGLLTLFLLAPLAALYLREGVRERPEIYLFVAAYMSWLVMYAVHSEYPSFMFAVIYAVLANEARAARPSRLARWTTSTLRAGAANRGPLSVG